MATSILQNERNRTKAARLKRKRSSSSEDIRQQPTPRGSVQHDSPMPALDELNTPNPFNLHAISNAPQQWRDALTESFSWTNDHPAEEGFRPFRAALCGGKLKPAPKINPATDPVDINQAYVFHGGPFVKVKTEELFEDAVFRHMMYPGNDWRKGGIRAVSQQAGALPDEDLEANTVKLVRHWADPDPKSNVYAVDVTGVQTDIAMLPPSKIIDQMQINKKQLEISSANITPKYTVVDLHNDYSDNVLTLCHRTKLWLFFPATLPNITHFSALHGHSGKLSKLHDKLEGGTYAVVFDQEAIFMPSGWIHATYALSNSIIIGTQWSSAEGLSTATLITTHDMRSGSTQELHQIVPFVLSLTLALEKGQYEECCVALQAMCEKRLRRSLDKLVRVAGHKLQIAQLLRVARSPKMWGREYLKRRCEEVGCGVLLLEHLPK